MNEFDNSISLRSEKELLNPLVNAGSDSTNGYLHSQWDIVRDGLWQGLSTRTNEAKENLLTTGVEAASSAGIAAGLAKAVVAGGELRVAAGIVGATLGAITMFDAYKRGEGIYEAYSKTNADAYGNSQREKAIAQYAGAGIFDYSLMLASAGLGAAGALHSFSGKSIGASESPFRTSNNGVGGDGNFKIGDFKPDFKTEPSNPFDKIQRDEIKPEANKLLDIEKVTDDLAYSLDYNISETAMSKISEALQKATPEDFNNILKQLEAKDRKFQGMDLLLGNWDEKAQRWDAVKMYYTDETLVTHLIVQKNDTATSIAKTETSANPRRTEQDIKDYVAAFNYKNHLTDTSVLSPGQIVVLPYAS